jgi:iron complex transport system substrate-binding protein
LHARPPVDRRVRHLSALVLVASLIAACTGTGAPSSAGASLSPVPSASATLTPTGTPAPTATPAPSFPLTVTDDEGTKVTIAAEPDSIVSLTPAATETLFALGVGDRIKGKSEDIFLYPPDAGSIPDVAKFGEVDVEKIVGFEPDVVIAGGLGFTPPDSIEKLRSLKVPVVVVYPPDVATVYRDIELIGSVAGKASQAKAITDRMRSEIAAVRDAVTAASKPKVFYETGTDPSGTIYGVADDSFLAEMIRLAGGTPVTTGSRDKYDMPVEKLIDADPDLILLSDAAFGVTAEQVAARPGWKVIKAVKDKAIRPIDDQTVTRPGPRLFLGLALLASTIHPDATIPSPSPIPPTP